MRQINCVNMLQEIIFSFIRSDRSAAQAEMIVRIHFRAGFLHGKLHEFSFDLGTHALLAGMQFKSFRRHLGTGSAVKGLQRLIPVQYSLLCFFSILMQVQFLHLPGIESLVGIRGFHGICSPLKAFHSSVSNHLMLRMAVFSVLRVGNHHFRPETPVQFRYPVQHFILAAGIFVGVFHFAGIGIVVRKTAEHGIVPHTHGPQAVQRFAAPGGVAVCQIGYFNLSSLFRVVNRNGTARKQQFIIRMGNQHQQICLLHRFFPALNPVRHFAFAKGIDFIETHGVFLFHGGQDPDFLHPVQFKESMVIMGVAAFCHGNPVIAALFLDHIGIRHLLEAQIQAVDRLVGRKNHPGILLLAAFPESGVFTVGNTADLPGLVHSLHGQSASQIFCLFRCRRNHGQQQKQNQKNRQQCFQFIHTYSYPLIIQCLFLQGLCEGFRSEAVRQSQPFGTGRADVRKSAAYAQVCRGVHAGCPRQDRDIFPGMVRGLEEAGIAAVIRGNDHQIPGMEQ